MWGACVACRFRWWLCRFLCIAACMCSCNLTALLFAVERSSRLLHMICFSPFTVSCAHLHPPPARRLS